MSATAMVQALENNQTLRSSIGIYGWAAEQKQRADRVKKYREYYDGDHDVKLTAKMKEMLRETDSDSPFSANYCGLIVDKMTDRMKLEGVVADNEAATKWSGDTLRKNRIDALSLSVHDAVVKDGDTFILEEWDPVKKVTRMTHEPAYDGTQGMVVLYDKANAEAPVAALKIWYVTTFENVEGKTTTRDDVRVNVYYADRIERYLGSSTGAMQPVESAGDTSPGVQKNPLGRIPVIHYRNKSTQTDNYGRSELRNIIPLQNTLNRTMVSMVMTSENTSFQRHVAYNFKMPQTISPGGVIEVQDPEGSEKGTAKLDTIEAGQIVPFVEQANWVINQIGTISSTPLPGWETAGESGEAKKERQEGLLGKVRRATVGIGNAWEDALKLAWDIEATYSSKPPAYEEFTAKWASSQVRNDTEVIDNAMKIKDTIPLEEYYRIIAPVYGWSDKKILEMAEAMQTEQDARAARLGVPMFSPRQQQQQSAQTPATTPPVVPAGVEVAA